MIQSVMLWAVEVERDAAHQVQHDSLDPIGILSKDLVDFGGGHRFHRPLREQTTIIVGDQRDVDDGHRLLQRQVGFRVLRHADHFPALRGEPPALRLRGEARSVDRYYRTRFVDHNAVFADDLGGQFSQVRTVGIGRADVIDLRPLVEGVLPAARPIHILVADHEMLRFHVGLEAARRAGADEITYAERFEGPDVGAIVDSVRGDRMMAAVPRYKSDIPVAEVRDKETVAGRPIGCVDLYLAHVVEQAVEAAATDYADRNTLFPIQPTTPVPGNDARLNTRRLTPKPFQYERLIAKT